MNLNLNALKLGMLIEAMFLSLTQNQKNSVAFWLGVGDYPRFHSISVDSIFMVCQGFCSVLKTPTYFTVPSPAVSRIHHLVQGLNKSTCHGSGFWYVGMAVPSSPWMQKGCVTCFHPTWHSFIYVSYSLWHDEVRYCAEEAHIVRKVATIYQAAKSGNLQFHSHKKSQQLNRV